MDCSKAGKLIASLRREKNLTQLQVAQAMGISDKTISKWERGLGFPDVSLLKELSQVLAVNIDTILLGDLNPNDADGGNMKRVRFYVCPNCACVINTTGEAEISCCGRKLDPLVPKPEDIAHQITIDDSDTDYYVTVEHEMSKQHYLSFAALVSYDRVVFVKLYPEQAAEFRVPSLYRGRLYLHCNQHGLWVKDI